MAVEEQYLSDVELILSHRYDNGADFGLHRIGRDYYVYFKY